MTGHERERGQVQPVEVQPDLRPVSFNIEGAAAYTGQSEWKVRQLIRDGVLIAVKEGDKVLVMGDSLRRYVKSLPGWKPK